MRNVAAAFALVTVLLASPGRAQEMPDIGFKSIGRGQPLTFSVNDKAMVGPNWIRQTGPQGQGAPPPTEINGFRPGKLPDNYSPLPSDIFTSDDFYADKELWTDPRYFRCNSPHSHRVPARHAGAAGRDRQRQDDRRSVGPLRSAIYRARPS